MGKVYLIQTNNGGVVGEAFITQCVRMTNYGFDLCQPLHQVQCPMSDIGYKKVYAYVLDGVKKYEKPIAFPYPIGCVTWVDFRTVKRTVIRNLDKMY